jgi:putative hydroxymethylpyrimidine transport system substrate-binding protein
VRKALLPALIALVALAASGCGEKEDSLGPKGTTEFEVLLDFFPNADHAGFYAAKAAGYFRDAGLDVKLRAPADPATGARLGQLLGGKVDLAIGYEPEVLQARDKGQAIVAVGALVQKPLTSIMSLPKARIRKPADLKGKTVGTAGIDYQSAYLRTILLDAGIDPKSVKERNIGFGFSKSLLTRKVDATLGAFWNYEGVQLRLKKRKPRIIRMEQAGVPTYNELVLMANEDSLDRDQKRIRAFIGALARGTNDLQKKPGVAIKALLEANRDLDPRLEREALKVTLPLFFPPKGKPFGYQAPQQWEEFTAWMRENKLLKKLVDSRGTYTNDLLPGAGI